MGVFDFGVDCCRPVVRVGRVDEKLDLDEGQSLLFIGVKLTRSIENGWYTELSLDREISLMWSKSKAGGHPAAGCHSLLMRFTPLISLSPDKATPQQRLVPLLHFNTIETLTQSSLCLQRQQQRLQPALGSPSARAPSSRSAFYTAYLWTRWGSRATGKSSKSTTSLLRTTSRKRRQTSGPLHSGFTSFRPHAESQ